MIVSMDPLIIIPDPPTIDSPPSEPARCPHCKKVLPEPEGPGLLAFIVVIAIIAQAIFFIGGIMDSGGNNWGSCKTWPRYRYHYLIPGYPIGCALGSYLKDEPDFTIEPTMEGSVIEGYHLDSCIRRGGVVTRIGNTATCEFPK